MTSVAAGDRLPYVVEAAVVEVAGKAFWYKRPLLAALQRAGVPRPMLDANREASKYELTREVWSELEKRGEQGSRVQRQIVRELAALKRFDDVVDADSARDAVGGLREVGEEYGVLEPARTAVEHEVLRREESAKRAAHEAEIRSRLDEESCRRQLYTRFCELAASQDDPQQRGLSLEPLLGELIALEGLSYQGSYRNRTVSQTDGFFTFDSFQYLIEARWRRGKPDLADLNAFASKVRITLDSTRGLFVSIAGFRDEVIHEFSRGHRNIILISGAELAVILEGRIRFCEAMRRKVDEAARTGCLFHDLAK